MIRNMHCVKKYKSISITAAAKLLLPAMAAILFSCNENKTARNIEPAFYYWKSVLRLSGFELKRLDSLHCKTLYIKFFDVDWNNNTGQPVPVAKLQHPGFMLPKTFTVIPTVFITNECIQKLDTAKTGTLAANIFSLMQAAYKDNGLDNIKELQIDCDWTASTRSSYFLLLEQINRFCKTNAITLSCTIRLHQIKFMSKTGVPPVNRGLLMCYNMGNLKNPATTNSIIETAELEKYTGNLSAYPLALDIALPLFEWKVLFRNNVYSGLIENLPDAIITADAASKNNNRFVFLKDTTMAGYSFKKGDLLRSEESNYATLLSTAASISPQLKNTTIRVSLYHLDSVILKKYSLHELETVYSRLR